MKTKYHYLLLGVIICFLVLFLNSNIPFECLFRKYLNIKCGTCGLTRGFIAVLQLDFLAATKYNLFTIPLFFSLIVYFLISLFDIVTRRHYINYFYNFVYKSKYIILICYTINFIYNNLK